jgi:hypothetical protein
MYLGLLTVVYLCATALAVVKGGDEKKNNAANYMAPVGTTSSNEDSMV